MQAIFRTFFDGEKELLVGNICYLSTEHYVRFYTDRPLQYGVTNKPYIAEDTKIFITTREEDNPLHKEFFEKAREWTGLRGNSKCLTFGMLERIIPSSSDITVLLTEKSPFYVHNNADTAKVQTLMSKVNEGVASIMHSLSIAQWSASIRLLAPNVSVQTADIRAHHTTRPPADVVATLESKVMDYLLKHVGANEHTERFTIEVNLFGRSVCRSNMGQRAVVVLPTYKMIL
jgi:hypothetical protein